MPTLYLKRSLSQQFHIASSLIHTKLTKRYSKTSKRWSRSCLLNVQLADNPGTEYCNRVSKTNSPKNANNMLNSVIVARSVVTLDSPLPCDVISAKPSMHSNPKPSKPFSYTTKASFAAKVSSMCEECPNLGTSTNQRFKRFWNKTSALIKAKLARKNEKIIEQELILCDQPYTLEEAQSLAREQALQMVQKQFTSNLEFDYYVRSPEVQDDLAEIADATHEYLVKEQILLVTQYYQDVLDETFEKRHGLLVYGYLDFTLSCSRLIRHIPPLVASKVRGTESVEATRARDRLSK